MSLERNDHSWRNGLVKEFYESINQYIAFCRDKPGNDWRRIEGYQILSNDMLSLIKQQFINLIVQFNDIAGATNTPVMNQETGEIIIF